MKGPTDNALVVDLPPELRPRWEALCERLRALGSVLVAFSGGVDSACMLRVAVLTLGSERVLAVTGRSPSVPAAELDAAAPLAEALGARHEYLDTAEFADSRYLANPTNRCYYCKTELYGRLEPLRARHGLAAVINGVNADDLGDHRPGLHAAREHGVHAPLAECGISKSDLRRIAAAIGVPVHDKPASPCLSSRVQYGEEITVEKLRRIDAAETFLRGLGFRELRVRHHGDVARIEIPAHELPRFADAALRTQVDGRLRELGYRYVTLDLRGFRSGSMNDVLLGGALAPLAR
ncbi:MAG: ATP-dependent sacrificial sulfur transferase LarE [Phycisphaerales bacterium]|nr:ATP-dependent sacrificial sulfur transferase LarE [Phycisphaerales bacterium]